MAWSLVNNNLAVSHCGRESVAIYAYLNQKTDIERLQYSPDVGRNYGVCPELFIYTRKLAKKEEFKTGIRTKN